MNETRKSDIIDEDALPNLPQNELPFPEPEIDLNEIFPEEKSDLNDLFPDQETRTLLKKMYRNKKDLLTLTDRFVEEDWSENNTETCEEKDNLADKRTESEA